MRITKLLIVLLLLSINTFAQKTVSWYRITADTTLLNYNPFQTGNTIKVSYYNINPITGEQYRYVGSNGTWVKDSLFPSTVSISNGVVWVSTWSGFTTALSNPNVRSINLAANLTATTKAYIPTNQSSIKEIEGHGFDIVIPSSIDTGFVRRYPSLSEANQGIDQQMRIRNVNFRGSNNMCMYLSANYGATF